MEKIDLFKILSAYFNNEKLTYSYNEEDTKELISLFKEQSLTPFLYSVYKLPIFQKYYIMATMAQQFFVSTQNQITNLMNKEQIKHLFFKGSVLYKLYPDETLRTRGDIDFLVSDLDYLKANEVLTKNGFVSNEGACEHHIGYSKNRVEVELHRTLFDDNEDYAVYFAEEFSKAIQKQESLYELKLEDHLVYVLAHYAKHVKISGAGVRPVIDICLMAKTPNLNQEYLVHELKNVGLEKFYDVVLSVGELIFNDLPIHQHIMVDDFVDYILNSGIHGGARSAKKINEINFAGKKKGKISFLMYKAFPSPNVLMAIYPYCRKHKILLPFYFFKNLFRLIGKRKRAIAILKSDKDVINQQREFYKHLGI